MASSQEGFDSWDFDRKLSLDDRSAASNGATGHMRIRSEGGSSMVAGVDVYGAALPGPEGCAIRPTSNLTIPGALSSAAALAVTAAEHDAPIDPALIDALSQPRERSHVLKYEDDIVRFMKTGSKQMEFPPVSSWHRLMIHRLAERFNLERTSSDLPAVPGQLYPADPGMHKSIVLIKTPMSCIPRVLLIDLGSRGDGISSEEGRAQTAPKNPTPGVMKLMKRDNKGASVSSPGGQQQKQQAAHARGGRTAGLTGGSAGSNQGQSKTVSEREREYAEARARIFGTSSSGTVVLSTSDGADSSTGSGRGEGGENGRDVSGGAGDGRGTTPNGGYMERQGNSMKVVGDGAMDLRGPLDRKGSGSAACTPPHEGPTRHHVRRASDGSSGGGKHTTNPGEWSESKVTWRNREAEKYDPDFVRHSVRHSSPQSSAPPSSAPTGMAMSGPYHVGGVSMSGGAVSQPYGQLGGNLGFVMGPSPPPAPAQPYYPSPQYHGYSAHPGLQQQQASMQVVDQYGRYQMSGMGGAQMAEAYGTYAYARRVSPPPHGYYSMQGMARPPQEEDYNAQFPPLGK